LKSIEIFRTSVTGTLIPLQAVSMLVLATVLQSIINGIDRHRVVNE